ncbi:MAG: hypothetical protein AB1450_13420 [Pseudomonadota bacterium]
MDHQQITKALDGVGHNWTTAAAAIGKSRTALVRVSQRHIKARSVAIALCALIDKTPTEVFPDIPEYDREPPAETRARRIAEGKVKVDTALRRGRVLAAHGG